MPGQFTYVVLCSLIHSFVHSQNVPPSIFSGPPNGDTYVHIHEYADIQLIPCNASGTPPMEYSWRKNGIELNLNDPTKYLMASRSGTLTFVPPVRDEGYFQCSASNTFGIALSNVTRVRPVNLGAGLISVSQQIATEKSSFAIKCTMEKPSVPSSIFQWQTVKSTRDTNPLNLVIDKRIQMDDNGTLWFAYVLKSDSRDGSIYRCHLRNPLITKTQISVAFTNITVNSTPAPGRPPPPMETLFNYSWPSIALVGQKVDLRCFFSGAVDISISWTKPDGSSPSGSDYIVDSNGKLTIQSVKTTDQGIYTCTGASNSLVKSATIHLVVESIPVFLKQADGPFDITATSGSTVTINCNPFAIPAAVPQWFQNGEPFDVNSFPNKKMSLSPDTKVLTIANVCKIGGCSGGSDLMVIQCNASNEHGYAFQNGYLNVLDATRITTAPTDVFYNPKEPANFTCVATTDSATTLTYSWLLNGQPVYTRDITTNTNILILDLPSLRDNGRVYIGTWTCNATNTHSWDAASAELYINLYSSESDRDAPTPGISTGLVTFIIFGICLAASLIAMNIVCLKRKRRQNKMENSVIREHVNGDGIPNSKEYGTQKSSLYCEIGNYHEYQEMRFEDAHTIGGQPSGEYGPLDLPCDNYYEMPVDEDPSSVQNPAQHSMPVDIAGNGTGTRQGMNFEEGKDCEKVQQSSEGYLTLIL